MSPILLLLLTSCIQTHASSDDASLRPLSSYQQSYSNQIPSDQPLPHSRRRDIQASVKAHGWPSTVFSPLCEAWAYFEAATDADGTDDASWRYLDALAAQKVPSLDSTWNEYDVSSSWGYANSTQLAIQSASSISGFVGSLDENLLPLALALRAHMPHCEMHRSLARDVAIQFGLYDPSSTNGSDNIPAAFCVVSRTHSKDGERIVLDTQVLADVGLLDPALKILGSIQDDGMLPNKDSSSFLMPLSDEKYHPDVVKESAAEAKDQVEAVTILYAQVGTTAFATFYNKLKESQVKFIVRHIGHISHEEEMMTIEQQQMHDSPSSTQQSLAIPTALQGYGVRLDIRNVEYKAFDDGPINKEDGNDEQLIDWNDSEHHPEHPARDEYLAGINLHKILQRLNAADAPLPKDVQSLQTALLQSHPTQLSSESIVPPGWKRQSLSLQAATVISSSSDPLETLQGISQNLPSIAHSLSSVHVSDELKVLAEKATDAAARVGAVSPGWGDAAFGLYVNSREVNVERPSFNVFQLLDVIREEDRTLRDLEGTVRPMLERNLGGMGDGVAFKVLKDIRRGMDMGVERLIQFGKMNGGSSVKSDDVEHDDYEDDELDPKQSAKKYRIDVGRGGKKAVLYLNDIEKDPEYRSWPNIEEMMMRMQFGQGPTVRRNMFTMLIVLDPTSGNHHPALNILAQLFQGQFPIRVGLLIVSRNDVAQNKVSQPGDWDDGDRSFHARDSLALMKYISKKYGGMVAMTCLINVLQPIDNEVPGNTVKGYIANYASLLSQMGVLTAKGEEDFQREMELMLKKPPNDDISYEEAFDFAAKKLIRPGMSFFNGIPLPDESDPLFGMGVNDILRFEQNHILSKVMKGEISDTKPRSIYATLLSGDNLYTQYHSLLRGSEVEYAPMATDTNDLSLMIPTAGTPVDIQNVDAFVVIEAVLDFDSPTGMSAAFDLLSVIQSAQNQWHESKNVSVAFRIVPSQGQGDSTKSVALRSLFCFASRFNAEVLKWAVDTINYESSFLDEMRTYKKMDQDMLRQLINVVENKPECSNTGTLGKKNYYTANGRVYSPAEGSSISEDDIKMLLSVELDRNVGIMKLISSTLAQEGKANPNKDSRSLVIHNAIALSATALNHFLNTATSGPSPRKTLSGISEVMESEDSSEESNQLYFSWNKESNERLQVEVSVILDPLTEPTQRVAPILLAVRDHLKLPLRLMIAPREKVDVDLPLSSYYRFVIDPLAAPDTNSPSALFSNLPTNHLLTVRMDVPEPWDVQQAFAVQDADNLRCDSRYGCGDKAYILANEGTYTPQGSTNRRIEMTNMEYTLKSLLFFGQCYDASTNSPPNGLQLTLHRSKLSKQAVSEIQISPDGSTVETGGMELGAATVSHDHTDTLVMKTVGYWQLRANPGVWDLQIEKHSRGAEIYHIVDGSVSPTGRIQVPKDASALHSKSLVMKDFSNHGQILLVKRNKGHETSKLFVDESVDASSHDGNETVHVFSLATGHAYERLMKIMMLSVTKRTTSPVKFWLFENFLSPSFKSSALFMAEKIGCQLEFVTYKWPEWLRGQSEKQRIIWGYKILFLDVLFPLDVKKIIYVDADQVIRGDLTELWNLDLEGAPYGYTPFCDSRKETLGYQFWRQGFWKNHLRGKPYHISALYVVDLERFRRDLVGDKLRATYQQLSADPNSLANLDQDLPNYAQHDVRIFSLPQRWLWCESWCSDETKSEAMTIDLCNNPEHKEAKISMAKRIISGDLFEESWEELDAEVEKYNQEFLSSRED